MFISFPFVRLMDSFWSRVKLEQSNWACLHLLYHKKQAQTAGATPTCRAMLLPRTLRGMLIISFTGTFKLSHAPCKTANELHSNYPWASSGQGEERDHYHTNLISNQLPQSACSCESQAGMDFMVSLPIYPSPGMQFSSRETCQTLTSYFCTLCP